MVTTTPVNDAGVLFLLSWGVSGVLLSKLFFDQELLSCVDLRRGSYWSRRALILHGVIFDVDEVCMNTDQNVLLDFLGNRSEENIPRGRNDSMVECDRYRIVSACCNLFFFLT